MVPGELTPLPPYTHVPGRAPHPLRDSDGHSYGVEEPAVAVPDVDDPHGCPALLRGITLFNAGYYWEAHEAWEGVWLAAGRTSPLALFVKGLIKLAAAGVKVREGRPRGVERHAERAAELFDEAQAAFGKASLLGLDPAALANRARVIAANPPTCDFEDAVPRVVFDFVLAPAATE